MILDFWYNNTLKDVKFISYSFSDLDCVYRGNMYDSNKNMIGDFTTHDSLEIESVFFKD